MLDVREDDIYYQTLCPLFVFFFKKETGILSQVHIVHMHEQIQTQSVRFILSYSYCAICFVVAVRRP